MVLQRSVEFLRVSSIDQQKPVRDQLDHVTVMADDHHSARIAVERLHKRLTRVDVKVIGGLVKYQQMWRIAGDKSQSQPRAFTARQGAHLLNRAVAGKAETTQLCPNRKSVEKGKSVSVRVDVGGRR